MGCRDPDERRDAMLVKVHQPGLCVDSIDFVDNKNRRFAAGSYKIDDILIDGVVAFNSIHGVDQGIGFFLSEKGLLLDRCAQGMVIAEDDSASIDKAKGKSAVCAPSVVTIAGHSGAIFDNGFPISQKPVE
jgi:hypothetical protein